MHLSREMRLSCRRTVPEGGSRFERRIWKRGVRRAARRLSRLLISEDRSS